MLILNNDRAGIEAFIREGAVINLVIAIPTP